MSSALVYLDVDGVLSPLPSRDDITPTDVWDDMAQITALPFKMPVSRQMGRRLSALPAELVWATSWEADANTDIAPEIGWGHLDVLYPSRQWHPSWNKWAAVRDDLRRREAEGRMPDAVIWVDDDLDDHLDALEWFAGLDVPTLAVCPARDQGLTPADIARIEAFLEDHPARDDSSAA